MQGSFRLRPGLGSRPIGLWVRGLLLGGLLGIAAACQAPWAGIDTPPGRLAPVAAVETTSSSQPVEGQLPGEQRRAEVLPEFEGQYQVGKTTCAITPVRMAFELRWSRGKGVMRFFYGGTSAEGKPVFISEDRPGGRDRFIFDDERYDSGRFIRADGVSLNVRRSPK